MAAVRELTGAVVRAAIEAVDRDGWVVPVRKPVPDDAPGARALARGGRRFRLRSHPAPGMDANATEAVALAGAASGPRPEPFQPRAVPASASAPFNRQQVTRSASWFAGPVLVEANRGAAKAPVSPSSADCGIGKSRLRGGSRAVLTGFPWGWFGRAAGTAPPASRWRTGPPPAHGHHVRTTWPSPESMPAAEDAAGMDASQQGFAYAWVGRDQRGVVAPSAIVDRGRRKLRHSLPAFPALGGRGSVARRRW